MRMLEMIGKKKSDAMFKIKEDVDEHPRKFKYAKATEGDDPTWVCSAFSKLEELSKLQKKMME